MQNAKDNQMLQSESTNKSMNQEQKDSYHLIVIWMTHYSMDYWKTKLPFCSVFTIAFVPCVLQQTPIIVILSSNSKKELLELLLE